MVHYDTYWRENYGGSVLQIVGQAVDQGWEKKDLSGCQYFFLWGSGGFPEQAKRSRLLTVPWEIQVQEMMI